MGESTITAPAQDTECPQARRIRTYAWSFAAIWTLLLLLSAVLNIEENKEALTKLAQAEARTALGRDILYRSWSSSHGGVYAPITPQNPPNPYLAHIPERDISTPSGRKLTLINPAYMTRQVYELATTKGLEAGTSHITSLNPIRPENAPDSWETKALEAFEKGNLEVSQMTQVGDKPFIRLMQAFVTEKSCLPCHASQGYKVGDIRGGLAVTLPVQPLVEATHRQISRAMVAHFIIWFLGLFMTGLAARQLIRSSRSQKWAEGALEESNRKLEILSLTDGLTGIANRRHFDETLAQEHARHFRAETELTLILLDIDLFKAFNDCYGHVAGDECLRQIGQVITESTTRPTDFSARYGGEEFVCILPGTDSKGAVVIAEKIRRNIQNLAIPHKQSNVAECVTASLGVITLKDTADISIMGMITQVDEMLYIAKAKGRNRVEHATASPEAGQQQ